MTKIISNLKKLFKASEYAVAFELIKGLDQTELLTPISDIILQEFKRLKKPRLILSTSGTTYNNRGYVWSSKEEDKIRGMFPKAEIIFGKQ